MPLNVALTGNVAAGKTAVTSRFATWGATIIDADIIVRQLQAPGSPLLDRIADSFGMAFIRPDGSLDRAALRDRILRDSDARDQLNGIMHPAVAARREELMREAEARGDAVVVNDIPLLFEVMDPTTFDMVVLVDAPAATRRRRLVELRGIAPAHADRLMAAQLPPEPKRAGSHAVIDNDGDLQELDDRARDVWHQIRTRAAQHLTPDAASRRLLVVMAHPDDEAIAVGGTLARYADAGVSIHLVCATGGEAATGTDLSPATIRTRRREDLDRSVGLLGVDRAEVLDLGDGTLEADDPGAVETMAHIIDRIRPDAIVTFGPDGITEHRDHLAVHAWTARARAHRAPGAQLLYVGYPDTLSGRAPKEVVHRPARELNVRVDIRPWADRKRAAIAAHWTVPFPVADTPDMAAVLFEREWFAAQNAPAEPQSDVFFDAPVRA